jgi:glycosyltransferase involved in cell wall biosynthesis
MIKPLVSVVTITYNHEKFIIDTIKGVLAQEADFEIEYIIADDCSPDNTEIVVREFLKGNARSKWVKYTRHAQNLGVNKNFIWALEQCQGTYIAVCEGDDYWTDSEKLQKQVNCLNTNGKNILCYHDWMYYYQEYGFFDSRLISSPHLSTILFRNTINYCKLRSFDKLNMDVALKFFLSEQGTSLYLNKVRPSVYRISNVGIWSPKSSFLKLQNKMETLEKLLTLSSNKSSQVAAKKKLVDQFLKDQINRPEELNKFLCLKGTSKLKYLYSASLIQVYLCVCVKRMIVAKFQVFRKKFRRVQQTKFLRKSLIKGEVIGEIHSVLNSGVSCANEFSYWVEEVLSKNKIERSFIPKDFWKLVYSIMNQRKINDFYSFPDESIIDKGNSNLSNIDNTLLIYSLLLSFGCFQLAYYLRMKTRRDIIELSSERFLLNKTLYIKYLLAGLFEKKDYSKLKVLKSEYLDKYPKLLGSYNKLLYFIGEEPDIFDIRNESDFAFQQFMQNKTVAIVGPAEAEKDDGVEIDSFDIVVRMNIKNGSQTENSKINGKMCDVSYYNNEQLNELINNSIHNLPKDIKWLVVSSNEKKRRVEEKMRQEGKPEIKVRIRDEAINNCSFFRGFTGLPKALFDILRFRPKKIKIFHADLMLTVDRLEGYYNNETQNDMIEFFLNVCAYRHDPLSQFYFLKNLYDANAFQGDHKLSRVLKMKAIDYMVGLERIYKKNLI